jgi:cellulose synthase/poly-beta-1,6-N-acetylglucosamine synthase-like glycosyltransferase
MGIGVGGVADARSLEIIGVGSGSSPHAWKREFAKPEARHAAALDARIDDLLTAAAERASGQLKTAWPKLSAATLHMLSRTLPALLGLLIAVASFKGIGTIVSSTIVMLPIAFRLWLVRQPVAASAKPHVCPPLPMTPDEECPIYSVIAPLRGEARVVNQLLSGIERLNYPADKLDVILVVEADDHETRNAITARSHRFPITVIPIPPTKPGTKPKALGVALPFARGEFTVIYDAEDRPERNQLRVALNAFRSTGNHLACVQARLCMDTDTSWLARYFTAEYAGHFDVFLPRLAALGLPIPLGGSSNHFRTETLRKVGGWDPYNVTEDADLGMRLARFGYRCGVIDSTTYEEAPTDVRCWLNQRSRWFKGWMQTWLVHMREPCRLFRELGSAGFFIFQLIVGGNALVALAHAALLGGFVWKLVDMVSYGYDSTLVLWLSYYLLIAAVGYSASAYLGYLGLSHRGVPNTALILMWTPIHWLLHSVAAWIGAFELIGAPSHWRKTEHGLGQGEAKDSVVNLPQLLRAAASG